MTTSTLSVLTWNMVSRTKSQGNYSCLATNKYGMARWSFEVTISCEYIDLKCYINCFAQVMPELERDASRSINWSTMVESAGPLSICILQPVGQPNSTVLGEW